MDNEYKLGQGNEENKENQEMPNGEVNFVLQEMPKEKEQEVVQTTEPMQEVSSENVQTEEKTESEHLKEESHIGETYQMGGNIPPRNNMPPVQPKPKKKREVKAG